MSFLAAWSAPALQSVGEAQRVKVIHHRIQQKHVPLCIKLTCMSRIIHVSVGYMYEYSIQKRKLLSINVKDITLILNFIYCSCNET